MRVRLSIALSLVVLAGCGGSDGDDGGGCGTDTALHPNAAYTGAYDAVFTPGTSGTDDAREFRLSVLADGTLSGVVRDPSASDAYGGTVTGSALDTSNACGQGQTYLTLNYTLADGRTGDFSTQRDPGGTIVGTYPIRGELTGSLTIQRTVVTSQ